MAVYLQSSNEENLYISILDGVWGSKTNRFAHWEPGDLLIVYVNRALAALFTITDEPYYEQIPIWPGDLYPYRVPIRLEKIIHPAERYSLSSKDARQVLYKHHTRAYGVVLVLGARPLDEAPARLLLKHIEEAPAWEDFNANRMLQALVSHRMVEYAALAEEVIQARPEVPPTEAEVSPHTQMQFYLAQLGHSLHFQVWIPKADQGRTFEGMRVGEFSMAELPPLPFSESVNRIIRNIDVIWLRNGHPTHLFEVEHTSAVYSGLLRMSDLTALIPSLTIRMYICSSSGRRNKVRVEVNRPTFANKAVPLAEICRFIAFERLADFMSAQRDYLEYFNVSILDELSESLMLQPVNN